MTIRFLHAAALVALVATLGCSPGGEEVASTPPDASTESTPKRATGGGPAGKADARKAPNRPRAPVRPKAPAVGAMAPEISAADIDGVEFSLSDYRGKVVMLDFWGHW